jgi:uncharacterized protein RhaS with RHS repeats
MLYNWNRDYNPALGRYVQSDPVGLGGGINTYMYVLGSPLDAVDIAGLMGGGGYSAAHPQPTPRPPVNRIWKPCEVEQLLRQMRDEGWLDTWKNHNGGGKFDFAYNSYRNDRFQTVDGHDYNSHMFGNYAAGYAAYQRGGLPGVGFAEEMGIVYDLLQHGWNSDLDASSQQFIIDGLIRARAEQSIPWLQSADQSCTCH